MTIYIDIIFLENLFMNYIIIFATGIILKTKIKIFRTLISSLIGSIYAVMYYLSNFIIYSNIILKILLSLAMVYLAFNPKSIRYFFRCLIIFYLTSFTFGGVSFALLYFIDSKQTFFQNGLLIGIYPMKMILAGGILGFIIITTAFKNIKNKISKNDTFCELEIQFNIESIKTRAIIDTGNFLKDPISKIPVIIVEKNLLTEILPGEILNNLKEIIEGKMEIPSKYMAKIRLIPFKSIGKDNGLLLGIKADKMIVNYQDKKIKCDNVIIGIYNGELSKTNKYGALIGLDIIEKNCEEQK